MKFILAFSICLFFQNFYSQNEQKFDSLKKLGRDSLIKLAIKKLNEPSFDSKNYDRIIVKANKESLIVDFIISIKLSDKKDCFYDAIYVALIGSGSGKSIQGFCDEPKFYVRSKSDQNKIDFVFDAINKENEVGDIPDKKLSLGNSMEITEKLTYYYVEVHSWSTYSHYKVDKITSKISEATHKHYARNHDDKDEFEIIK